jgi:hypothetical protein
LSSCHSAERSGSPALIVPAPIVPAAIVPSLARPGHFQPRFVQGIPTGFSPRNAQALDAFPDSPNVLALRPARAVLPVGTVRIFATNLSAPWPGSPIA